MVHCSPDSWLMMLPLPGRPAAWTVRLPGAVAATARWMAVASAVPAVSSLPMPPASCPLTVAPDACPAAGPGSAPPDWAGAPWPSAVGTGCCAVDDGVMASAGPLAAPVAGTGAWAPVSCGATDSSLGAGLSVTGAVAVVVGSGTAGGADFSTGTRGTTAERRGGAVAVLVGSDVSSSDKEAVRVPVEVADGSPEPGIKSAAWDAGAPAARTSTAPTAAAAVPRRSPPWIPVRDVERSDLCITMVIDTNRCAGVSENRAAGAGRPPRRRSGGNSAPDQ